MTGRVFIIAEAGVNHNGNLETALQLVDAAAAAGADAVKFQTFSAAKLVTARAEKAEYQQKLTGKDESQYAMLKRLELDDAAHLQIIERCSARQIMFLSTPFDEDSADLLLRLGVETLKIPSGEITNLPFLRHLAGKGKPLILSTGMASLAEVAAAVETIAAVGNPPLTLLHCVTEYPAPADQINLRAMDTLRQAFHLPVGYSDHTDGLSVPLAAVGRGASVIEKHFTLDRNMEGPDHRASLEPPELASLVRGIREVEAALGDGIKRAAPCELGNRSIIRKSLVAVCPITRGEPLTVENTAIRRPATGISPADADKALGLTVNRDVAIDEPIGWDMLT